MATRPPALSSVSTHPHIVLRGVRVHNLKQVDLEIPLNSLVVLCGPSGAGKSSLAFETVFAEGQRRFIESFSASARQSLERIERPDADRIAHVPPSVAIRTESWRRGLRETVATLAEIDNPLRRLFLRIGQIICPACRVPVQSRSPEDLARSFESLAAGTRVQLCLVPDATLETPAIWRSRGYARAIVDGATRPLAEISAAQWPSAWIVVDRLTAGQTAGDRVLESTENAFRDGAGRCLLLVPAEAATATSVVNVDGRHWNVRRFSRHWECHECQRQFQPPQTSLLEPGSSGGCPACRNEGDALCPVCLGSHLSPDGLALRIQNVNLAEFRAFTVDQASQRFAEWTASISGSESAQAHELLNELQRRVDAARRMSLGHVHLSRRAATLSGGQIRRLQLAAAIGSRLTGTLCVIDEPSSGLAVDEIPAVVEALRELIALRNSLIVIDHASDVVQAADHVIELGPGAGPAGGTVVYAGPPADPGFKLRLKPQATVQSSVRRPAGWITLRSVDGPRGDRVLRLPLGVLCVVSGRSGSGKTRLVHEVLVPALRARLEATAPASQGTVEFEDPAELASVSLLERVPLTRSSRSNVATWIDVFDEIRDVFALTSEARQRGFGAQQFSFNAAQGGQCRACRGSGVLRHEMQFLPDITLACPECGGTRYRREILDVKYRGCSIADVLAMSSGNATSFFRTHPRLSGRLQMLKQIGLDYLVLGQATDTLSGGEAQRLRLAACLASRQGATLIVCDDVTSGLHPGDILKVLQCLEELLSVGHSVVLVDNHPLVRQAAGFLVELESHRFVTTATWNGN